MHSYPFEPPTKYYDLAYFIRKFEMIPEALWADPDDPRPGNHFADGSRTAWGHCHIVEHSSMRDQVGVGWDKVRDVQCDASLGKTPKERLLNFLRALCAAG